MKLMTKALVVCIALGGGCWGQWLNHREPGTPRLKDGRPNLRAPAPKLGGRTDLSGVWLVEPTPLEETKRIFGADIAALEIGRASCRERV